MPCKYKIRTNDNIFSATNDDVANDHFAIKNAVLTRTNDDDNGGGYAVGDENDGEGDGDVDFRK